LQNRRLAASTAELELRRRKSMNQREAMRPAREEAPHIPVELCSTPAEFLEPPSARRLPHELEADGGERRLPDGLASASRLARAPGLASLLR